jgi:type I restriction enzyme, S subunit
VSASSFNCSLGGLADHPLTGWRCPAGANQPAHKLRNGDVLFSIAGTLGRVAIVHGEDLPSSTNQAIAIIRPSSAISPGFLAVALRHASTVGTATDGGRGVGLQNLNLKQISELLLNLPPANEQHRIVRKIASLQAGSQRARAALEAIPPLLDKLRQSVLAAAFRGDLTKDWRVKHSDVEPADKLLERLTPEAASLSGRRSRESVALTRGERTVAHSLPRSWTMVRLKSIARIPPGYAFKSEWFVSDGIRLLRGTNIVPGGTRWDDSVHLTRQQGAEFKEYDLADGDVVIAMDRPVISSGLKVARICRDDLPALLLQRVGRFRLSEVLASEYLYAYLNSCLALREVSWVHRSVRRCEVDAAAA